MQTYTLNQSYSTTFETIIYNFNKIYFICGIPLFGSFFNTNNSLADELFRLESEAIHGCLSFFPASSGMIVDGLLRTSFCEGSNPKILSYEEGVFASKLTFTTVIEGPRCIHVRPIDLQSLPSEIFAHVCDEDTSRWRVSNDQGDGFWRVSLNSDVNPFSLCLAVGEFSTKIVIAKCDASEKRQKWKKLGTS